MAQKQKKQKGGELVYGVHAIIEVLRAKRRKLISVYTTKPTPKVWRQLEKLLPRGTQIQYISRDALDRLAGTVDHQNVIAWVQPYTYRKKPFDPTKHPFLLFLDSIQDVRNLGAILRSAYCTGVNGVVIAKRGGAPLTAAALKSSAGLAEHLEIMMYPSPKAAAQELSQAGYHLYMATVDGTQEAQEVTYQSPLCLVIGNEAVGISKDILKYGQQIALPQREADISYNASVAAGILLFLVATQQERI